jgi:hypothetical protein
MRYLMFFFLLLGNANAYVLTAEVGAVGTYDMYLVPRGGCSNCLEPPDRYIVASGEGSDTFEFEIDRTDTWYKFHIISDGPSSVRLSLDQDWVRFDNLKQQTSISWDDLEFSSRRTNKFMYAGAYFSPIPEPQTWACLLVGLFLLRTLWVRSCTKSAPA